MITVKFLGGAKRSFLSDKMSVEKNSILVSDLLTFLQNSVEKNMPAFDTKNILVAINGVDSSALQGNDTSLRDGDVVSIIPIVHGGSKIAANFRILGYDVALIRMGKLETDPKKLLETLRAKFPSVILQGIRLEYVLNTSHARRIIAISLAASKSGILLSNKIETDMLMRFAASRQISEAIRKAGLKGSGSILIAIGKKSMTDKIVDELGHVAKPLLPFPKNANFLKKEFGIEKKELDCIISEEPLEDLLVERAAVLFN